MTADHFEHLAHPLIERLQGEKAQRAFALEVFFDAFADLIEKGEVVPVRSGGGAFERVTKPRGVVVMDLVLANLDGGAVADQCDHSEVSGKIGVLLGSLRKVVSVFEKAALHWITGGSKFECLDFPDEFADVFELSVDRNVADVGDGIDLVKLLHDLDANVRGGHLADVISVEFGKHFVHGAVDAIHRDRPFFAGFDQAVADLFAVDGLACAIAFHHAEFGPLDLFVGGVAVGAVEALPASADSGAILRHPGVENLVLEGSTLNTSHG